VTCANADEARLIARSLVQQDLIACANISEKTESVYKWKNATGETEFQSALESTMICKTTLALAPRALSLIRSMHSYQVPCILQLSIAAGDAKFLEWVNALDQ
jgi:periplasmic divalent cation tolerance protein